jgi:hypothetical protein
VVLDSCGGRHNRMITHSGYRTVLCNHSTIPLVPVSSTYETQFLDHKSIPMCLHQLYSIQNHEDNREIESYERVLNTFEG